jgi:Secretion system C-terminal sorting domain
MRQMLLIALSAMCCATFAQPTITDSYLPSAGDTLVSAFESEVDPSFSALITGNNGPFTWDLNNFVYDNPRTTIYADISAAQNPSVNQFPGANMVVFGEQDGETYLNRTSTSLIGLGYAGADPGGFDIGVVVRFEPPVTERRAPLNLFDFNSAESNLVIPIATDQLPDSLLTGLGVPFVPDSIRIRINTIRSEIVNAYGTVILPGNDNYEVLRLERMEQTTTRLDVLLPFFNTWQDVTDLLGGGGGLGDFLGLDTTITHRFYANNVKEEVAVLTLNNDKTVVENISVRVNSDVVSTDEPVVGDPFAPGTPSVSAFPNPAVEWVRFDCYNLPADDYTLKIFNIIGRQVWAQDYTLSGNKGIRIELENFKKGTYLYSLVSKKGQVIGTKRLVIVKP